MITEEHVRKRLQDARTRLAALEAQHGKKRSDLRSIKADLTRLAKAARTYSEPLHRIYAELGFLLADVRDIEEWGYIHPEACC